jgi:predicted transcriptional regulator
LENSVAYGVDQSTGRKRVFDNQVSIKVELSKDLIDRLNDVAGRKHCGTSWIVQQAIAEWLAEEQRRYHLTMKALKSVGEGRTLSQEEVEKHFAARRNARARGRFST